MIKSSFGLIEIAGLITQTNVTGQSFIDLDVKDIINYLEANDFDMAYEVYSNGKHSFDGDEIYIIQNFEEENNEVMSQVPLYQTYVKFFNDSKTYADDYIRSAFQGKGIFQGKSNAMRKDAAVTGIQVLSIWMHLWAEVYEQLDDCNSGLIVDPNVDVNSIDEMWALYSGSLEGEKGNGKGVLTYALAELRCKDFGTCGHDGNMATSSSSLLGVISAIRGLFRVLECKEAENEYIPKSISLASIPLLQSLLRYSYLADPKGGYTGSSTNRLGEWGSAWTFALSVLPQIQNCNPQVAESLRSNLYIGNDSPLKDGFKYIQQQLEKVYTCLGVNCTDIGEMRAADGITVVFPKCTSQQNSLSTNNNNNNINSSLTDGAIAGITIAVLIIYFASVFICYKRGYKKGTKSIPDFPMKQQDIHEQQETYEVGKI